MASLLEDIKTQSAWVVKAFGADKLTLDHSLESFKSIDKFFDQHAVNGKARRGGRLSQNLGPILFSIGAYVGETILINVPGSKWITDDNDPEGEVTAAVQLPDGTNIWPMQRVMKRFKNGDEDGIYAYGAVVIKEMAQGDYWEKMREAPQGRITDTGSKESKGSEGNNESKGGKPWWKFW